MNEFKYIPEGKLASYVKLFWLGENYSPVSNKERVLPNGSSQLIINLGTNYFRHFEGTDSATEKIYDPAVVAGIHTHNIFLDSHSRISTIGVVLQPGAVSALFDVAAHELTNQVISLKDIAGPGISELREKLIKADSPEGKFKLLESFLMRYLDQIFQPNPAVIYSAAQLKEKNGIQSIAELRNKIGYSSRHFSGLFKEIIGITPKQYAGICRFQHTLAAIRESRKPDWANLALNCGFYDQSHFIHSFKDLSGISPTDYFRNQQDSANHLPL